AELELYIPTEVDHDAHSKWSVKKTKSSEVKSKIDGTGLMRQHRLFQCLCGTDHTIGRRAAKTREVAWENVGCMGFAMVTTTHEKCSMKLISVDEVASILDHNDTCQQATEMLHSPCLPLHPDLRDYAMSLLRRREPIRLVRSKCLSWAKEHWQEQQGDGSHRFHLTPYDSSSLYRTAARERGIPQRSSAADNLDCWFHSEDPRPPSPLFTSSCLHYQPYLEGIFERFEIIISTPQQRDAAWTFGYKKQIIMDGTFRICSARVLCFIIMVINDQNKGIPVAHIVFSAKKHTKAVHADYNGALLTRLVEKFKIGMGVNPLGDTFCAAVAMTDNDPRERLALETTWEDILCILCLFHTWQAWRNSLNKFMRGVPKGDPAKAVRSRLGAFLMRLLKVITNYTEAIAAFNTELQYFRMLGEKNDDEARWQSKAALAFLAYLQDYLKTRSFWKAWSRAGVIEAAARMGVLETQVARTSNHLESYNDKMKNIHFEPSKHSGRLPRIDVWIAVLITDVIPKFFENLHEARELADYRNKM
ncbi:hypothetical protein BKA93DRAFT_707554, partial [Sparassis latifolia]